MSLSRERSGEEPGEDQCRPQPQADPMAADLADCASVIAEVWSLLDGECTVETTEKLRHHLDECPSCLRQYGVEERVKMLIATKCGGDRAPEALLQRVRLQISRTTIVRSTD